MRAHSYRACSQQLRARAAPFPPTLVDVRRQRGVRARPDAHSLARATRARSRRAMGRRRSSRGARSSCTACTATRSARTRRRRCARAGSTRAISTAASSTGASDGGPVEPWTAPTRWVTRERPKIDRIACPWLVRRFIDPAAEFFYVPPKRRARVRRTRTRATPFDVPDVEYSHDGERCSFDAFVRRHALRRCGACARSPTIVRAADTDTLGRSPQAAGLLAVSLGLGRRCSPTTTRCCGTACSCTTRCTRGAARVAASATAGIRQRCGRDGATRRRRRRPAPTRAEAFRYWLRLGFISFGGPAGQIAIMHRELVDERRWISERRFLHALNYCMVLPGPEAQQLATYIGWLLHRTWGGIVAGALFVAAVAAAADRAVVAVRALRRRAARRRRRSTA